MKKIAVLTSGGDASGMNAAIRAVVRSAMYDNICVFGVEDGFLGLYENRMQPLTHRHLSERINQGGTFLGTSRFLAFNETDVQKVAINHLKTRGIEGLVIIGGDGSYHGALALSLLGFPVVAIPASIDNDIAGTDFTIGFMTAFDTILTAIDHLRDTSSAHQRISLIEVMGRYAGDLAISAAIAGGCEFVITPETGFSEQRLKHYLRHAISLGKKHALVLITEHMTDVHALAKRLEGSLGRETRATILGHVQRGGKPCGFDRLLASQMGDYAVSCLKNHIHGVGIAWHEGRLGYQSLQHILQARHLPRLDLLTLCEKLY